MKIFPCLSTQRISPKNHSIKADVRWHPANSQPAQIDKGIHEISGLEILKEKVINFTHGSHNLINNSRVGTGEGAADLIKPKVENEQLRISIQI